MATLSKQDAPQLKMIRRLSVCLIVVLVYSVVPFAFDHHSKCTLRTECPLCKFALDFSFGDGSAMFPGITPNLVCAHAARESLTCIFGVSAASLTSRAPPVSHQHTV